MFGPFVVLYLFLGGCSAGVLLVSSLWSFAFHLNADRTRPETDVFRALRNRSFAVGFVVACLAALCLLADLGRPERFVLLFLRRYDWALESPVCEILIYSCAALMLFEGVFTALAYRSGVKNRWMQLCLVAALLYAAVAVAVVGLAVAQQIRK